MKKPDIMARQKRARRQKLKMGLNRLSLSTRLKRWRVFSLAMSFLLAVPLAQAATLISSPPSEVSSNDSGATQHSVSIVLEDTLVDHTATIVSVSGTVEILKSTSSDWEEARKGDLIGERDQVRTEENSYVEISYDEFHLNYVRIDQNTLVEFQTLEPTIVHIEDGSLFSQLDGLVEGAKYEVSTPTSVAAVRGTSFVRAFDAEAFTDDTSVVEGVVNVLPFDEEGYADASHSFEVVQDQTLGFDRETLTKRRFDQVQPKPLSHKTKKHLHQMHQQSIQNRERFAGGPDQANRLKSQFQKIKQNPKALKRLQANRMQRPGSVGNKPHLARPQSQNKGLNRLRKRSLDKGFDPKNKKMHSNKSLFKEPNKKDTPLRMSHAKKEKKKVRHQGGHKIQPRNSSPSGNKKHSLMQHKNRNGNKNRNRLSHPKPKAPPGGKKKR